MRIIAQRSVLIRMQSELPAGFKVATDRFHGPWCFMRRGDVSRLEKKVRVRGWNCIKVAEGSLCGGVGKTPREAVASALQLALRRMHTHFNAVEVESIEVSSYPWFAVARVRVYPYRIQESAELVMPAEPSGSTARLERKRAARDSAGRFRFGGAVPMLKELLTSARNSETAA